MQLVHFTFLRTIPNVINNIKLKKKTNMQISFTCYNNSIMPSHHSAIKKPFYRMDLLLLEWKIYIYTFVIK